MNPGDNETLTRPSLVCPAGTPAALRTAVDAGADEVYCGFQNATNARNFPGLNFTVDELRESVAYAHARGARVLLATNTFAPGDSTGLWRQAIDDGVRCGVDAVIVADIGVAHYVATRYPQQRLHLVLLPRIRCEARGVAADSDGERNQGGARSDPVRDRGLHLRQHRHDGRRPLQPDQLRDRHLDQHRWRLFAGA
jgi:hypothetical protein